jgi:alpha-beta hydrolase superfamily lysophospholipase
MKHIILLILAIFLFSACTTIEISEGDAFDAHRTITPATFNIEPFTLNEIELETDDSEVLNGWYLTRENAKATVVYFGGNGFLMVKSRPLIQAYADMDVNLLLFDYRGYGLSSGEPTVEGVKSDAQTAYEFAIDQLSSEDQKIIVHGHSMGAFLSSHISGENQVDGYIMESPVSEVKQWTKKLVPWILRPFVRFDIAEEIAAQSNLENVSNVAAPLMIVGGTSDDVTPFSMAEDVYEASASESKTLVEIEGGSHNNLPEYSKYRSELKSFLESIF